MRRCLPIIFLFGLLAAVLWSCQEPEKDTSGDLVEARTAMMKRDYLEAEKNFERYLIRNPDGADRWEVWNSLTDLALSVRNDRKAALELMEAMLIEYADDPARKRIISGRLAEQYRMARKYERAITLWSSVMDDADADPVERARACRNLATVYLRRLEFELAKESLGYCLELEIPDTVRAECLYDLAQTHMGMGDMDQAITYFRSVLGHTNITESQRTLTVFMLADALDQKGEETEALRLFTGISETYPNPRVVEQRIAFLKAKRKKTTQANARK